MGFWHHQAGGAHVKGRRAAMAAGAGVVAVFAGAFIVREDIAAWYVGYRFVWAPEGFEVCSEASHGSSSEWLVKESEPESRSRCGIWSPRSGAIAFIEAPPGEEGYARPSAISSRGHVVGVLHSLTGSEPGRPFFWQRETGMQLLPGPQEGAMVFSDINDRDQAVRTCGGGLNRPGRAFLWTPQGGYRRLADLSERHLQSSASRINEAGWVAGSSLVDSGEEHPVLWLPPEYRPRALGLPTDLDGGVAIDLNDRGTVLVSLWHEGGFTGVKMLWPSGFIWTEERGFTRFPVPPGYSWLSGIAVSQLDSVLLRAEKWLSADVAAKGFLFRDDRLQDLPRPSGALDMEYHGLSDHGWLIGTARLRDGPDVRRGFVAEPVR